MTTIRQKIERARRIVIKVGSALVCDTQTTNPHVSWLRTLAQDVETLRSDEKKVVIVTSGAVALGRKAVGIDDKQSPFSIPCDQRQAAAAIGQIRLMQAYYDAFVGNIAQILLVPEDTEHRGPHLNVRASIGQLLDSGVIPVINENNTTTDAVRFGDNDRLSARVAQMIQADLLIQLSTIDGFYTGDPAKNPNARHIPLVESLKDEHLKMAGDVIEGLTVGGMKSKLEAARLATSAGTEMIITKGSVDYPLSALMDGGRATLFMAQGTPGSARKRWIATHLQPKGVLTIDDGALKALKAGKSLLPAGVTEVSGMFSAGDAVIVRAQDGHKAAIGLCAYNHHDAAQIKGHKSSEIADILGYFKRDEMIHRNDLAFQD